MEYRFSYRRSEIAEAGLIIVLILIGCGVAWVIDAARAQRHFGDGSLS